MPPNTLVYATRAAAEPAATSRGLAARHTATTAEEEEGGECGFGAVAQPISPHPSHGHPGEHTAPNMSTIKVSFTYLLGPANLPPKDQQPYLCYPLRLSPPTLTWPPSLP